MKKEEIYHFYYFKKRKRKQKDVDLNFYYYGTNYPKLNQLNKLLFYFSGNQIVEYFPYF